MKTINIKGKEYVPVSERVKEFHETMVKDPYADTSNEIKTEIISNTDKLVVVKATVFMAGNTYTGHSQAVWGEGMMGKVALEVAETSAIGRALGFAGFGIVEGIASADEITKNNFEI